MTKKCRQNIVSRFLAHANPKDLLDGGKHVLCELEGGGGMLQTLTRVQSERNAICVVAYIKRLSRTTETFYLR